jgi:hypothetical protein
MRESHDLGRFRKTIVPLTRLSQIDDLSERQTRCGCLDLARLRVAL